MNRKFAVAPVDVVNSHFFLIKFNSVLGHPALSFYFILRGSVNVLVEDKDRRTGKITKTVRLIVYETLYVL